MMTSIFRKKLEQMIAEEGIRNIQLHFYDPLQEAAHIVEVDEQGSITRETMHPMPPEAWSEQMCRFADFVEENGLIGPDGRPPVIQ